MNKERIDQLIKQSTTEVPHERDWDATSSVFSPHKFAELLIRECALIAGEAEENEREGRSTYHVVLDHFGLQDE